LVSIRQSSEFVFAVVGHVGSGTSEIASALKGLLSGATGGSFDGRYMDDDDRIQQRRVQSIEPYEQQTIDVPQSNPLRGSAP